MNLLTQGTNSLVKKLPIHRPRSAIVKNILYANTALFGFYMLSSGPGKLRYQRTFTAAPNSSIESLLYFHFAHTSVLQFLFTSGVFYTIGNYHVAAYGCSSFMRIFGASALGGSLLTAIGLITGATTEAQAGAMAPAAGLIAYNVFRNPGWFKLFLRPVPLLAALTLYGAFYGDRAAIGGVSLGYLAFLFGL